jgi:hypothetical protein
MRLKKYISQGKAVKVTVNMQGGKIFRLISGFLPRIRLPRPGNLYTVVSLPKRGGMSLCYRPQAPLETEMPLELRKMVFCSFLN